MSYVPAAPPGAIPAKRKPKRVFMWVILAINGLFAWWLIAGLMSSSHLVQDCTGLSGQALDICNAGNAGTAVGTGIGIFMILFLCAVVDVILGVIWLVTRRKTS